MVEHNTSGRVHPRKRKDVRFSSFLLTLGLVAVVGAITQWLPGNRESSDSLIEPLMEQPRQNGVSAPVEGFDAEQHSKAQRIATGFRRAVRLLHLKKYSEALAAWQDVLALAPDLPEARVNLGYSLLGLQRYPEAEKAFLAAIELRIAQANAYYGLALALAAQNKIKDAAQNMQTYLQQSVESDAYSEAARKLLRQWQNTASGAGE